MLTDYGDLIDIHDFDHPDFAVIPGLAEQAKIARTIGTPWFLGAVAVNLSSATTDGFALRAERMEAKMVNSFEDTKTLGISDGVGFLRFELRAWLVDSECRVRRTECRAPRRSRTV
ncbi:MAG: hypothetical protein QM784_25935 [Polyangiaceae bacterium]